MKQKKKKKKERERRHSKRFHLGFFSSSASSLLVEDAWIRRPRMPRAASDGASRVLPDAQL
jgi:hypothetical protein